MQQKHNWQTLALFTGLSCASLPAFAASQCSINIENEFHLKDDVVSIYVDGEEKVRFDDDEVFIDNKALDLNSAQEDAADDYRDQIATQIPKIHELGEDALEVVDGVIDDVGETFEAKDEFSQLKLTVREFYQDIEGRYYQNDTWVFKKDAINEAILNWPADLQSASDRFNNQAIGVALGAIAKQMQDGEGGLNLMKLQSQAYTLSTKLKDRFEDESKSLEDDAHQLCADVQNISSFETKLQAQIPELKDYPIFIDPDFASSKATK